MRVVANWDKVFECDVETLDILSQQNDVDIFEAPGNQRERGTQIGVEVKFFSKAYVYRTEAPRRLAS